MSKVFQGYERQYSELFDSLSKKCASASALDGEQRRQKVSEIRSEIEAAELLIRKMDLEARSVQPVRPGLLVKLRKYKSDLTNIKNEVTSDQGGRVLMSTESRAQSSDPIKESIRILNETNELAASTLQELKNQRQALLHLGNSLDEVDENIGKSKNILADVLKRINRNKWIIGGVIAALAFAIITTTTKPFVPKKLG